MSKLIALTISCILLTCLGACTKYYDCTGKYGVYYCTNGVDSVLNGYLYASDASWINSTISSYINRGYTCKSVNQQDYVRYNIVDKNEINRLEAQGIKCKTHN